MKRIFVTGASSGIGRATAELLAGRGDQVWGSSRDLARLPVRERFHPVTLELAHSESIRQAFDSVLEQAGHLDVLINNAGAGHFGPAEHLAAKTVEREFATLVFGHVQLMQLAIAAMRKAGGGLIVNVTSLAARLPVPFMAAYNAAKAAMTAFTMTAQIELRQSNVKIVDLQPADISTSFNDAVRVDEMPGEYRPVIERTWQIVDRNLKAAPPPEVVARAIAQLVDSGNPPPRVTVGNVFQSRIAPLIFRFLPQRVGLWGLRKYYRL